MTTDVQTGNNKLDALKWGVVVVLIALAIWGNHHYSQLSSLLRFAAVLAIVIGAGLLAVTTVNGRQAFDFAREAQLEVRKVVWPTRQETVQTTVVVSVFVVIMSIILWIVDWILSHLLAFIVG